MELPSPRLSIPPSSSPEINVVDDDIELPPERVKVLRGHFGRVLQCTFNPLTELLATGSADSTVRLWSLNTRGPFRRDKVLRHADIQIYLDISTIGWNIDGRFLATGSYDGFARIWNKQGILKKTLPHQKMPIYLVKWNKSGNLLLCAGGGSTITIWQPTTGLRVRQFLFPGAAKLGADWRDSTSFACYSSNRFIYICTLHHEWPIRRYYGHTGTVYDILWNPQGNLLASCSNDKTIKIWTMDADSFVRDLQGHTEEVTAICWSPTGPGTCNPSVDLLLASASFDSTIRLWDVDRGVCVRTLTRHVGGVFSIAFSPNGMLIASGGTDWFINVWSTHNGWPVYSHKSTGWIYDLCWNSRGDKVGVACGDYNVIVLDLSR